MGSLGKVRPKWILVVLFFPCIVLLFRHSRNHFILTHQLPDTAERDWMRTKGKKNDTVTQRDGARVTLQSRSLVRWVFQRTPPSSQVREESVDSTLGRVYPSLRSFSSCNSKDRKDGRTGMHSILGEFKYQCREVRRTLRFQGQGGTDCLSDTLGLQSG